MTMKQRSEVAADRAASYLREMGIRPSSKAYQYLLSNERVGDVPARPPQSMAFLRLGLYMINRVVY